jgi:hypothetical protein
MKEKRYYLISPDDLEDEDIIILDLDDEGFITEAERQGNVYTESGFVDAFNTEEVSCFTLYLRVIEVEIP